MRSATHRAAAHAGIDHGHVPFFLLHAHSSLPDVLAVSKHACTPTSFQVGLDLKEIARIKSSMTRLTYHI